MKQINYKAVYEHMTKPFRGNPKRILALRILDIAVTYIVFISYPLTLLWLLWKKDRRFSKLFLIPGVSFLLLSRVRGAIDRARPYEAWDIQPLIHKDKKGHSMPSRHVFSSALIAMAYLTISVPVGVLYLVFTLIEMIVRILEGVHYPSDVAAGAVAGVLLGLLMLF